MRQKEFQTIDGLGWKCLLQQWINVRPDGGAGDEGGKSTAADRSIKPIVRVDIFRILTVRLLAFMLTWKKQQSFVGRHLSLGAKTKTSSSGDCSRLLCFCHMTIDTTATFRQCQVYLSWVNTQFFLFLWYRDNSATAVLNVSRCKGLLESGVSSGNEKRNESFITSNSTPIRDFPRVGNLSHLGFVLVK